MTASAVQGLYSTVDSSSLTFNDRHIQAGPEARAGYVCMKHIPNLLRAKQELLSCLKPECQTGDAPLRHLQQLGMHTTVQSPLEKTTPPHLLFISPHLYSLAVLHQLTVPRLLGGECLSSLRCRTAAAFRRVSK